MTSASSIIEQVRSFSFALRNWRKTSDIIECPPGTWSKPYDGSPPDWCALVCCPNCRNPAAISALIHKVDWRGKLNKEWTCPKCKLTLNTLLNAWGKQTLFGIAYEERTLVGKEESWKPKMIYKHADDGVEARKEFTRAYPMKGIRIVAIGQVLGYYSEDRDDKVLSVS
jgi:hypothetical protein